MRWRFRPAYRASQHREKLVFAWLPVRCADGWTRWLCRVRLLEVFDGTRWCPVRYYNAEVEKT